MFHPVGSVHSGPMPHLHRSADGGDLCLACRRRRAQHPYQRDQTAPKRTGDSVTVLRADDIDKGIRRASGLSPNAPLFIKTIKSRIRLQTEKSIALVLPACRVVLSAPCIILNSGFSKGTDSGLHWIGRAADPLRSCFALQSFSSVSAPRAGMRSEVDSRR